METAGRVLLVAALILAILGVGALALSKLGVDRLPATLIWRSDNVTVFVPIGLMVVASIVGTILLNIFLRRGTVRMQRGIPARWDTTRSHRVPRQSFSACGLVVLM